MFDSTLSIDLGASFTKVAHRRKCIHRVTGQLEEDAKILMLDGSPLIPTLAIRTGRTSQPWVFGQQAARLNPTKNMEVFQNWKANLFRPENNDESAAAVMVAGHFFGWLKTKVEDAGVNLSKLHARVALPAFRTSENVALIIARCMELSGWDCPMILRATEPHANVVGLFSAGRNVTIRNGVGAIRLHYGQTFDPGGSYIQRARRSVLYGTESNLFDALVIDIGAFTLDLAAMTFDFNAEESGDGLKLVREESHALGVVNDLDRPLFAELGQRHGFEPDEVAFNNAELLKQALYQGKSHALLIEGRGPVWIGESTDQASVDARIKNFGDAIWANVDAFVKGGRKPAVAFVTGGGVKIASVAAQILGQLSSIGIRLEPLEAGAAVTGRGQWLRWKNTGEGLDRLATALGGASVVLQDSVEPAIGVPAAIREEFPRQGLNQVTCRCQGGNKDCCFCAGRGSYSPGLGRGSRLRRTTK